MYVCIYECIYICMSIHLFTYACVLCVYERRSVQHVYVLFTYAKSVINSIWYGKIPDMKQVIGLRNSCHIVPNTPPLPINALPASCAANWLQPVINTSTSRKHNVFQIPEIVMYQWRLVGFYCGMASDRFVVRLIGNV
jgi:hypothetical protein